jgi:integrase
MSKILLRFVHEFKDRHGKTRRYFRRPGFKRAPLPGLPGSEEFMRAYQSALDLKTAQRIEIGAARVAAGTVADLVARYYRSTEFLGLKASTQSTYRSIIEPFRSDHGDKRVALLKRQHVKDMLAKKAGTPTAANNWLKRVRQLMAFARDIGMRADDPTIGVKPLPIRSLGHPAWSADDIAAFRRRHPSGTRARLAMEMALCTMQRRGDLVRMGRQHLQGGVLTIRQEKTGTVIEIPILPDLQAELDQLPTGQMTFLVTDQGKAFVAAGFGNLFRDWATEAGLPKGYNTHGLRKAGATRGAEAGWTDHEIAAWGGWKSLSEVQRYTRTVNRRKLAQGAVHKLTARTPSGKPK